MAELVIIRHGESVWNQENKFTGWMDVPLSPKGKEEARKAGELLRGYKFDKVFVSHLIRAVNTMQIVIESMQEHRTPAIYHIDDSEVHKREHHKIEHENVHELHIVQSKDLAERYYGDLQGLNKDDCRKKYGEEQVHIWRRSFDIQPPGGESLKDTMHRVMPFYEKHIAPELRKGRNVLIVAHGNSLRAIIKHLENISDEDIPNREIATGSPIIYDLNEHLHITSKKELK